MLDTTYNFNKTNTGVPIKAWTKGVQLEDAARGQLTNVAQLPLIYKWVAASCGHAGRGRGFGATVARRMSTG